ncbi:MAG: NosD domain-containing protein [Methanomicrobiales archaeon]|nr:NosD domain-containing protein [Methanomicrobiales archaeon]
MRWILLLILLALLHWTVVCTGTEIIVPDDYPTIQDAIDGATEGDVVVLRDGMYTGNIIIDRSITLRSENGASACILEEDMGTDALVNVTADNTEIRGITITAQYSEFGVFLGSENSTVADCIIEGGWGGGIRLESANSSRISGNTIHDTRYAIDFSDSSNNLVEENLLNASAYGMRIDGSSAGNTIANNTIRDMQYADSYGLLAYGSGNRIFLNRFSNNPTNAIECGSNIWNSTEMRTYAYGGAWYENYTGNYWDDYSGTDMNGDGIGDGPYPIPSTLGSGEKTIICMTSSFDHRPMLPETASPPIISGILETGLTNSSVTISWQTNIPANNRVLYGTEPELSPASWSEWANSTSSPSIVLSGLTGNTTYHYSVYSFRIDDMGVYANSTAESFTTLKDPQTLYVDDDRAECPNADYTGIQEAVNAAGDGDTIVVCNGTYNGKIVVNRSLSIRGIDTAIVDAKHESGFTLVSSGSTIQGFVIQDAWDAGVKVCGSGLPTQSHNHTIRENRFVNSTRGVYVNCTYSSTNNLIERNTFTNSNVVLLEGARGNHIENNTFYTSVYVNDVIGVRCRSGCGGLSITTNHTISGNVITSNPIETPPIMIHVENGLNGNTIADNMLNGPGTGIRAESDYNRILRNSVTGMLISFVPDDIGILMTGRDSIMDGNTVLLKSVGIKIIPYSPMRSINITMRDNIMEDNDYGLFVLPVTTSIEGDYPSVYDLDMWIGSTNVVRKLGEERRIYYIRNATDQVFDYGDVAFFACIDCENVTLRYLAPNGNSHGMLLHSVRNSSIENVQAYGSYYAGIAIYDSSNLTIKDSGFTNNGHHYGVQDAGAGVYIARSRGIALENTEVETNWCYGIWLGRSNDGIIADSNVTDNGPPSYHPPTIDPCRSGTGIFLYDSSGNEITRNRVRATFNPGEPGEPSWIGGQKYGIYSDAYSGSNTIYDNYFENIVNARHSGVNAYNITKTPGRNIVGGPYLGGNYWHDYAGEDTIGGDGLGDTQVPYDCRGNISMGGDYHPLTGVVPDVTPPRIVVISPEEGGSTPRITSS